MRTGIAMNSQVYVESVRFLLLDVDFVFIIAIHAGFVSHDFIETCAKKLDELINIRKTIDNPFEIEVDGGINNETAKICKAHGANLLVSGCYLFKADDAAAVISGLRND